MDIQPGTLLRVPRPKRLLRFRSVSPEGTPVLVLAYGDTEITFDEPDLLPFGERLGAVPRFVAEAACGWTDPPLDWPRAAELLEALVAEGVLAVGEGEEAEDAPVVAPVPPAGRVEAPTWADLDRAAPAVFGEAVEPALLECFVPAFRVAHPALDADGRQVGEINTAPEALRVDVPTEWRTCPYPGSRFEHERPMNVSALRQMSGHWNAVVSLLGGLRAAFAGRLAVEGPLTVGQLHALSNAALGVVGYVLVRPRDPVASGALSAPLASVYRVVDGMRGVTANQMLRDGEDPDAPADAEDVFAYAERHGELIGAGVCAGPQALIVAALRVAIEGVAEPASPADLAAELGDADAALDYALLGASIQHVRGWLTARQSALAARLLRACGTEGLLAAVAAAAPHLPPHPERRETVFRRVLALNRAALGPVAERVAGAFSPFGDAPAPLPSPLPTLPGIDGPRAAALADVLGAALHDERAALAAMTALQGRLDARIGRPPPSRALRPDDLVLHARFAPGAPSLARVLVDALGVDPGALAT